MATGYVDTWRVLVEGLGVQRPVVPGGRRVGVCRHQMNVRRSIGIRRVLLNEG